MVNRGDAQSCRTLATDHSREPSADRDHDRVRDEIGGEHPRALSLLAPRLPAMCGSETLAMLVSSTSMNVAIATTTAISHGLNAGRQVSAVGTAPAAACTGPVEFSVGPGTVPISECDK